MERSDLYKKANAIVDYLASKETVTDDDGNKYETVPTSKPAYIIVDYEVHKVYLYGLTVHIDGTIKALFNRNNAAVLYKHELADMLIDNIYTTYDAAQKVCDSQIDSVIKDLSAKKGKKQAETNDINVKDEKE